MRLVIVLIGASMLGLAPPTGAQSVGVAAGILARHRENFGSAQAGAFSAWLDLGQNKWRTDVDVVRSQLLRDFDGSSERSWMIGVAGVRRFPMSDRPEVLHVLIGAGVNFDRESAGGLLTGLGMDVPVGRLVTRIQRRLHIGFLARNNFESAWAGIFDGCCRGGVGRGGSGLSVHSSMSSEVLKRRLRQTTLP